MTETRDFDNVNILRERDSLAIAKAHKSVDANLTDTNGY